MVLRLFFLLLEVLGLYVFQLVALKRILASEDYCFNFEIRIYKGNC